MDIIETKILHLLKDKEEDITISDIANELRADRHTIAKRLEVLQSKGLIEFRTVGKSKMWKLSKSPFLNALKNNDEISNNIKSLLQHMDGQVNIREKNKVIWSNTKGNHCCNPKDKKCKECNVDETFKTGNSSTSIKEWSKRKVKIITEPIKDTNNKTIAVIEVIKDIKKR
ncbi:MAG: winged helix-turn-helix domain-containing protein [Candidatus Woesearchaeota archaeon]